MKTRTRRLQYETLERRELLAADLDALLWASLPADTRDTLAVQLPEYYAVHGTLPAVDQSLVASLGELRDSLIPPRPPQPAYLADVFVNGGASLSGVSLAREAALLNWTRDTLLTRSAVQTRAGIQSLLDSDGRPQYPVVFVNGGKAASHGRALGPEGRQTIVDFVHAGGSYVGNCAGAYLAADYSRHVTHLWQGWMGANRRGTQTVSFASTPDHPIAQFLVAHGIEDMVVRNIPHIGGPRFSATARHPEGTVFLGEIISATRSLRRTVGTPYLIEFQPTPTSGVLLLQPSHPEWGNGPKVNGVSTHTILNAALLQYARDRSQVSSPNIPLASLPVSESEATDWITLDATTVDLPTMQPMPAQMEPAREKIFAAMAEPKRDRLSLRQFRPEAVDAVFGPMLV